MAAPLRKSVTDRGVYWAPYTRNGRPVLLIIATGGEYLAERIVFENEDPAEVMERCWAMLRQNDRHPGDGPPKLRIV